MISISGITWITTYNCNFNCDHCFFETQGNNKYMEPELIERALSGFKYSDKMFWQHLSGGEIFLQPDTLFSIIEKIQQHFKGNIGLSTNGYWATSKEKTETLLQKLQQHGINGLAVSADYYHTPFMNKQSVQNLLTALTTSNMKVHSYLMGARLDERVAYSTKVNTKAEELANELKPFADFPLAPTTVRSIGKGSRINQPKENPLPTGYCTELCTCLGTRTPFNPAMVWIDPYGNVMICYGIIIGNLYKQSLNEIIENYHPEQNPILKALSDMGPQSLHNLATEHMVALPEKYFDECDLCYTTRKALRKIYPAVLGPDECYPE